MIEITDAVDTWDCLELAAIMRPDDLRELEAQSGREPFDVLVDGVELSTELYLARLENLPLAMYGVVAGDGSFLEGYRVGVIWMLTSHVVERHPKAFWQQCKRGLAELLTRWDVLVNVIDCRHERAIRWGRRLGFQFEEPEPMGVQGLPFRRFWVTRESANV